MNRLVEFRTTKSNLSTSSAGGNTPVLWSEATTPLGRLYMATNDRGICAIKFGRLEPKLKPLIKSPVQSDRETQLANLVGAQLQEYFAGRRRLFDLPLDLSLLTPFQINVLAVTSRIPWGEVWSYQRVANEMGWRKSSRPVGQALARNPIPIAIPCHRVIASDGTLGGYCGKVGLDLKRWLLRHEGVQL